MKEKNADDDGLLRAHLFIGDNVVIEICSVLYSLLTCLFFFFFSKNVFFLNVVKDITASGLRDNMAHWANALANPKRCVKYWKFRTRVKHREQFRNTRQVITTLTKRKREKKYGR